MSFDFGQKRIGAGSNQQRNSGMYTKTILGQSVGEASVPVWTADKSQNPFVLFQDPKTRKLFGVSKDMAGVWSSGNWCTVLVRLIFLT